MDETYNRNLFKNAELALKDGDKNMARRYLERLFLSSRDHNQLADGWYYMSQVEDDPAEKRKALEQALSYRMTHARARRALAILDGRLKADEIINPDQKPAPLTGDAKTDADHFMCPNCGARMSFAPDGQSLVCDFCTSGGAVDASGDLAEEKDFFSTMATLRGHSSPVARKVFHCDGCGAEFILPPNDISEDCAYCNSPHVVSHQETRELMDPDAIIPHAFNRRQAAEYLVAWVQEHAFTPQGKVQPPRGFYLPLWTFDFAGMISYSGQRYQDEDNPFRKGSRNRVKVTERGDYPVYIDDLIMPANKAMNKEAVALLDTYSFREAKPYDARYLVGWAAEAYEIELGDASLEARSRAYKFYKKKIRRDMSELMNITTSSANMAIDSYKLLMLPIWITTYTYGGEEYHVFINGQNGAVRGELAPAVQEAHAQKNRKEKGGILGWLDDMF